MKKLLLLAVLMMAATNVKAEEQRYMECEIFKGVYGNTETLMVWKSTDPNEFPEFPYYGRFETENAYIIWGHNIGYSVTPSSKDRFQIRMSAKANDQFLDGTVLVSANVNETIDLAVNDPRTGISVHCVQK